jgi:hypothetical protein
MKKILFCIIALLPIFAMAQVNGVGYTYDDAGNRTGRYVINLPDLKTGDTIANDSSRDFVQDSTSIYHEFEMNNINITVFPNPNGGKFDVVVDGNITELKIDVFLHSLNGTIILEKEILNGRISIDISDKENGAYILSIIAGELKKTIMVIKN